MFVHFAPTDQPLRRKAESAGTRRRAPIRVLSMGDYPLVHEGIRALLRAERDIELVGEVGSEEFELLHFMSLLPEVVLMGAEMSSSSRVRAISLLRSVDPSARIIAVVSRIADIGTRRAISAGVHGCLPLSCALTQLPQAIRAVASGLRFFDSDSAMELVQRTDEDLKVREVQILEMVAAGKANKEIADELSTTEGMIKNHIGKILGKLQASDRTHAVVIGFARGIIELRAATD